MTVANQASAAAADGDHQQALLAAGMGGSVGGIGAEGERSWLLADCCGCHALVPYVVVHLFLQVDWVASDQCE